MGVLYVCVLVCVLLLYLFVACVCVLSQSLDFDVFNWYVCLLYLPTFVVYVVISLQSKHVQFYVCFAYLNC